MSSTNPALKAWLRRTVLFALGVVVTIAIVRMMRSMDWESVGRAMSQLSWWHLLILLLVLLARQVANAAPLAYYIEGVSLYRATLNDLSATMLTAFAPPPSDVALRVSMFSSWGIRTPVAIAGTTMNAMTFFIVRFSAPLFGFILVLATGHELGFRWLDVISLLIAAALIGAVLIMTRSDSAAKALGEGCGRLVCRVKRSVSPAEWGQKCLNFQRELSSRFAYAFPRSLAVSYLMVFFDGLLLLLAMRFVGLSPQTLSVADIAVAFLFAFPLTAFPMSGMGVVDVAISVACIEVAGTDVVQEPVLAALIIWRVFNVAGPLLLGIVASALWKTTTRTKPAGLTEAS
ncbi:lysylphosphatidylglycerol synthase domain-containing protein [Glutamicibacter sp. NPDC087344]|uniref:lysylphosphatidylglycerol synthase domain-containing protein n=1 Tax=Glutamicibacter sp. NPDC087344 TaxID=3363994 RepID=UPI0037F67AC1